MRSMVKESPNHEKMRKEISKFTRKIFEKSHDILESHITDQPKLPLLGKELGRNEILYQPDIVLRRKGDGAITHVIEVENRTDITNEIRTKLALANLCFNMMKENGIQKDNPKVFFVSTKRLESKKRKSAEERVEFMKNYLKNIDEPEIFNSVEKLKKKLRDR